MWVKIAHPQLILFPKFDPGDRVCYFPGDELKPSARRLVVEKDPRTGKEPVGLAIVDCDRVTVNLGDAVGTSRVERSALVLRRLLHFAEHLRGRRLIEPRVRLRQTDRLQHPGNAHAGQFAGQDRLRPGGSDKRLRGKVIDLVRLDLVDGRCQRMLVHQIAWDKLDAVLDVPYSAEIRG